MNADHRVRRRVASEVALGSAALTIGVFLLVAGALAPPGFGGPGVFGNVIALVIGLGSVLFGVSLVRGAVIAYRLRRA